jgi:hypothetical protein
MTGRFEHRDLYADRQTPFRRLHARPIVRGAPRNIARPQQANSRKRAIERRVAISGGLLTGQSRAPLRAPDNRNARLAPARYRSPPT